MRIPVTRNTAADQNITQKYIFWPALKNPTSGDSSFSVFSAYSFIRRIHRLSLAVHVIGARQLKNSKANATTKPTPNHGCRNLVIAPPPKSGVRNLKSHGE